MPFRTVGTGAALSHVLNTFPKTWEDDKAVEEEPSSAHEEEGARSSRRLTFCMSHDWSGSRPPRRRAAAAASQIRRSHA